MHRFLNAHTLVAHFHCFKRIGSNAAMTRQLRDGSEGFIMYLSSLPMKTLEEVWTCHDQHFAETSIAWLERLHIQQLRIRQSSALILHLEK